MKSGYAPIVHHFLKLAILLGFTAFIAYLLLSGNILLYITPQLAIDVAVAEVALVIFAGFQCYLAIRSLKRDVVACECGHDDHDHSHDAPRSIWKNVVIYGLFVLPLLLGIIVPSQANASSQGVNLNWTSTDKGAPAELVQQGEVDPAVKELFKTDNINKDYAKLGERLYKLDTIEMKDQWFIEKLQALNTFASVFEGKQIKFKGFVSRDEGLAENQFLIGRMAMTHCIADITPYTMVAEAPNADTYANGSWVTLTGTIGQTTYKGQTVAKLVIQNVEPASAPSIPYVYPDWDFASKLQ
ncbi:MAG: TIGR03943 family putative permease subunit [Tumebacillaceae bacterium]